MTNPIEDLSKNPEKTADKPSSYVQIIISSAIIGGSSVLKIGIGMVRTKAMALLLGPSGVGLMGLYVTIIDLTRNIVSMGINSSGVRQIAEAAGSGNATNVARTAAVLERTALYLGVLGAVFLFGFSRQLSVFTFGNEHHDFDIKLLSLAILFSLISAGQEALIQGLRQIGVLAKLGILGALYGTFISIPAVYWLGTKGVALTLVLVSAMALGTSWWYRRKIKFNPVSLNKTEIGQEQLKLLKLGFAFMASGLLMSIANYLVRIIVIRKVGYDSAGLYQSAWALGGLYIGLILQAMGTDFYPRLTASANNNSACNRLVNEQALVSLLMAGPGVVATLSFAPFVILLFYSAKFNGAVELLRWLCLGMTLRVVSWPMGFIIMAKNAQWAFFLSELAWTVVYLSLTWLGVSYSGLNGAGMAFFGSYIFHVGMIYGIVRWLWGFRWSRQNLEISALYLGLIVSNFLSFQILPTWPAMVLALAALLLSSFYSLLTLLTLVGIDRIPSPLKKLLALIRLLPTTPTTSAAQQVDGQQINFKRLKALKMLILAYIFGILFCAALLPYISVFVEYFQQITSIAKF